MVSGGMACVKYVLFLFNLIFAISGIAFITVGAVFLIAYKGYSNFVDIWLFAVPVLMIIIGVVVFITSFFGCCGAVKESHCMIITFSVLLLCIFALEIGAGISAYMMRSKVSSTIEKCMNTTLIDYKGRTDFQKSWDIIQTDFSCCGINGPNDWQRAGFSGKSLPRSCCIELSRDVSECDINNVNSKPSGCKQKLQEKIEENGVLLGSIGVGIALVQLIGVIFACCLARSIRREYETVETTAH